MRTQTPSSSGHPLVRLLSRYQYWLLGGLLLLVAVVTGQMFYPYERSLPGAHIGEVAVGSREYDAVIEAVRSRYSDVPLKVLIDNETILETTSAQAGLTPDYDGATRAVTHYSVGARLVPFSFLYKMLVNRVSLGATVEQERFSEFAGKVTAACRVEPQDAALQIKAGKVTLDKARTGRQCSEASIRRALEAVQLRTSNTEVHVKTETQVPAITDEDMAPQLAAAEAVIRGGLRIGAPDNQWKVTDTELASWLKVVEEKSGTLRLDIDEKKVQKYLAELDSELIVKPVPTVVTYQDGLEIGRSTGVAGRTVEEEATLARIREQLFGPGTERVAWVAFEPAPSPLTSQHTYTQSAAGVQALLEQWDKEHRGRYGIIVQDLSGRGLNGSLNTDMDFVTASTYKMFLAYATFHAVEEGKVSLSDRTTTGLTVQACIDEMILHSTNECAIALMDQVGWNEVHTFIRSQFPHTSLDNGASADGEKHTTVRDEAVFLQRLTSGSLQMSPDHHAYLLDLMKRQVYRGGIPTGVPDAIVANKVGFYAGYKHDVAIIYGPKGAYILAILSYGGADWEFADLSRKVAELLQ